MRELVRSTFAHDAQTFVLRGWPRAGGAKTVWIVEHGLGEHGGRYDTLPRHLDDLPVHFWSYDLRGHGESTGKRGDAAGIPQYAADLEAILPVILERSGAEEILLMGHSMGAAVVGWYLTTRAPHPAVKNLMLSASPVHVPLTLEMRLKAAAARVLNNFAPTTTLASGLPVQGISSDPAEVGRYQHDPLVHDRLSARLGLSLLRDPPQIIERAGRITLPILLWHGVDDPIAAVAGSRALHAAIASTDKALVEFPDCRHEVHHEAPPKAAVLFERLRAWVGAHVRA